MEKVKKPFYKKWWFITIAALIVIGLIFSPSEEEKLKAEEEKIAKAELKDEVKELKEKKKEEDELAKKELRLEQEREEKEKKESEEAKKLAKKEEKALKAAEKKESESKKENSKADTESAPSPDKEVVEVDRVEEIESSIKEIVKDDMMVTEINQLLINENMGKDDGSYIVLPHLIWEMQNGAKRTREMIEDYSDHLAAKLAEQSDIGEITVFWEVPYHMEDGNIAKFMYERQGDRMSKIDNWLAPKIR